MQQHMRHNSEQRSCRLSSVAGARRSGFTLVELLVVIGIIGLVLALGIPAFNQMNTSAQLNRARQGLNGILTRAQITSDADQVRTAVRIFPAAWEFPLNREDSQAPVANRQVVRTFRFSSVTSANPFDPAAAAFDERFEPVIDGPRLLLPQNTWMAPLEALDTERLVRANQFAGVVPQSQAVLQGEIGRFELNAGGNGERFLDADDFLLVFEPERGLASAARGESRQLWRLLAFDPRDPNQESGAYLAQTGLTETAGPWEGGRYVPAYRYQRHSATGVVLYPRDGFVAPGLEANYSGAPGSVNALRRQWLEDNGVSYFVDRKGGGLVAQSRNNEEQ